MKMPKVLRPEIEIEYKGIFGFLYAVFCICAIGIKRMSVDFTMLNQVVCNRKFLIVPKYKIEKRRFDGNNPQDGGSEPEEGEENENDAN